MLRRSLVKNNKTNAAASMKPQRKKEYYLII